MKYIKILFGIGVLFLMILVLHFGSQIVMFDFWYNTSVPFNVTTYFKEYSYYISLFIYSILFFAVLYSVLGLWYIIKNKYFNVKASKFFKIAGVFYLLTALFDITMSVLNFSVANDEKFLVAPISQGFLFIIIGFGLITVSDILLNGLQIKEENDLTI